MSGCWPQDLRTGLLHCTTWENYQRAFILLSIIRMSYIPTHLSRFLLLGSYFSWSAFSGFFYVHLRFLTLIKIVVLISFIGWMGCFFRELRKSLCFVDLWICWAFSFWFVHMVHNSSPESSCYFQRCSNCAKRSLRLESTVAISNELWTVTSSMQIVVSWSNDFQQMMTAVLCALLITVFSLCFITWIVLSVSLWSLDWLSPGFLTFYSLINLCLKLLSTWYSQGYVCLFYRLSDLASSKKLFINLVVEEVVVEEVVVDWMVLKNIKFLLSIHDLVVVGNVFAERKFSK